MAVVKGAFHSDLASGNVGSLCATRWRSLQVVKSAWTGTVPNTSKQVTYQVDLKNCAQAWGGTLTAAEREEWERATEWYHLPNRFGELVKPTGYHLFIHVNMILKRHSQPLLTKPAQKITPAIGMVLTLTAVASYPRVQGKFYSTIGSADRVEYWKAGPYDSGGRKPIAGEWRIDQFKTFGGIYYDYNVTLNKWYWYKARWVEYVGYVSNFHIKQLQII